MRGGRSGCTFSPAEKLVDRTPAEWKGAKQTEVQRVKIERDHWVAPAIEPATVARVIDDPFAGTEFAL